MDAPVYLPSDHFIAPVRIPRILNTTDTAIADLLAIPAARAIVQRDLPEAGMMLGSAMLKPHLGNFSFRSLVQFGAFNGAALDHVDAELRALGPVA